MLQTVFEHEWLLLIRNKFMLLALAALLGSGFYSLYYGSSFAARQQAVLTSIDTTEAGRLSRHLAIYKKTDTLTGSGKQDYMFSREAYLSDYRMQKTVYNPLSPFAAMSIGQRDVFPYYYNLFVTNNVYTSKLQEIRNPAALLAGHFDLAFVVIYLLPLFMIAAGYNLLSVEKDRRTLGFLKIHAPSISKLICYKVLFRFVVFTFCFMILSLVGFALNGISFEHLTSMVGWLFTGLCYLAFWSSLIYFIISLNSSSSFNSAALITLWTVLLLFIPSLINQLLYQKQQDPESIELITSDRDEDNYIWALPLKEVITRFQRAVPRFNSQKYPVIDSSETRFMAYIELSQSGKNKIGKASGRKQADVYNATLLFNPVNPVFAAATAFNCIAKSEISDHLSFVDAATDYQQQRRYFIIDNQLTKKKFGLNEFLSFPKFNFNPPQISLANILLIVLPLLVWTIILLPVAFWKTSKI